MSNEISYTEERRPEVKSKLCGLRRFSLPNALICFNVFKKLLRFIGMNVFRPLFLISLGECLAFYRLWESWRILYVLAQTQKLMVESNFPKYNWKYTINRMFDAHQVLNLELMERKLQKFMLRLQFGILKLVSMLFRNCWQSICYKSFPWIWQWWLKLVILLPITLT